jgi:hypothetical protein
MPLNFLGCPSKYPFNSGKKMPGNKHINVRGTIVSSMRSAYSHMKVEGRTITYRYLQATLLC